MDKGEDCYYFLNSICNKGAHCTYRHVEACKTTSRSCDSWSSIGLCELSGCPYRHPNMTQQQGFDYNAAPYNRPGPLFYDSYQSGAMCKFQFAPGGCLKMGTCPFLHVNQSSANNGPPSVPFPFRGPHNQISNFPMGQNPPMSSKTVHINPNMAAQANRILTYPQDPSLSWRQLDGDADHSNHKRERVNEEDGVCKRGKGDENDNRMTMPQSPEQEEEEREMGGTQFVVRIDDDDEKTCHKNVARRESNPVPRQIKGANKVRGPAGLVAMAMNAALVETSSHSISSSGATSRGKIQAVPIGDRIRVVGQTRPTQSQPTSSLASRLGTRINSNNKESKVSSTSPPRRQALKDRLGAVVQTGRIIDKSSKDTGKGRSGPTDNKANYQSQHKQEPLRAAMRLLSAPATSQVLTKHTATSPHPIKSSTSMSTTSNQSQASARPVKKENVQNKAKKLDGLGEIKIKSLAEILAEKRSQKAAQAKETDNSNSMSSSQQTPVTVSSTSTRPVGRTLPQQPTSTTTTTMITSKPVPSVKTASVGKTPATTTTTKPTPDLIPQPITSVDKTKAEEIVDDDDDFEITGVDIDGGADMMYDIDNLLAL